MVQTGGGGRSVLRIGNQQRKRLQEAALKAGPLASLPASHCMKSASFGSSLFVEVDGQRSPDLSCANQRDSPTAALAAEARQVTQAAEAQRTRP